MPIYEIAVIADKSKASGFANREVGEPVAIQLAGLPWGTEPPKLFKIIKMELTEEEAAEMCAPVTKDEMVMVAKYDEGGKMLEPEVEVQKVQVLERAKRIDLTQIAKDEKSLTSKACVYAAEIPKKEAVKEVEVK